MNALAIIDLNISADLDSQALAEVKGAGDWHLLGRSVVTGSWGSYQNRYKSYVGTKFHDGYLVRQYREGWKRQRTQTEYTTWDHFVRI